MPFASSPLGHDPWQLVESSPDPSQAVLRETLFALGNGRIGIRGAHEEGALWPGTEQDAIVLNGFYEFEDRDAGPQNQFIVDVPNGKAIRWSVDDEPFDPTCGRIEDYRRTVNFRSGQLTREFVWVSPRGRRVAVHSRRLVCLARENVYAIAFELRSLDGPARIAIESSLTAPPAAGRAAQALERIGVEHANGRITLVHRTRGSGLQLASAIEHALRTTAATQTSACGGPDNPGERFTLTLPANEHVRLTKYCALVSSNDAADAQLVARAADVLTQARMTGFDGLCAEQLEALARYWSDADVEIDGDELLQQALRFNLLHLLQSVGRDGRTAIAAEGLTGRVHDGHVATDTEIAVFPALLHTQPETARRLLEYRCHTLPAARARARVLHHRHGALFASSTITGPECAAPLPTGSARVRPNAEIAFAMRCYWGVTGDDEFMLKHGAELVIETARSALELALDLGLDTEAGDDFYTAAMLRMHLRFAVEVVQWLAGAHPSALDRLAANLALDLDEPTRWLNAATAMPLPQDAQRRVHPQADALLALLLLDEQFDLSDKRRDFIHHEPLRAHDTPFARCVLGVMACELGYREKGHAYIAAAARTDLDDACGDTREGVHIAAMAGSWLGVVAGFAGLRMRRGMPVFSPQLPAAWQRCTFKLHIGAAQLRVHLEQGTCQYELLRGSALALRHRGSDLLLTTAHPFAAFPAVGPPVNPA